MLIFALTNGRCSDAPVPVKSHLKEEGHADAEAKRNVLSIRKKVPVAISGKFRDCESRANEQSCDRD